MTRILPIWQFVILIYLQCNALLSTLRSSSIKSPIIRYCSIICNHNSHSEFLIESAAVESLKSGAWVKFISGASNQDLPLIRNMCYLYTLAGVDCIDLSTDPAVIAVANEGIQDAITFLSDDKIQKPIIMMSVNDDEDPHFRKAVFSPEKCPTSCPRPCEKVCPAWAIPPIIDSKDKLNGNQINNKSTKIDNMDVEGVIASRCYGCGRCIPICPLGLIITESYTVSRETIKLLFTSGSVEAIEIHTLENHKEAFSDLWDSIGHEVLSYAKILSISFPNMGDDTIPYLDSLQSIITKSSSWDAFKGVQIWQTDGRPMSGDIGKGTVHKSSNLALYVLSELNHRSEEVDIYSENTEHENMVGIKYAMTDYQRNDGLHNGNKSKTINSRNGRHFIQVAGGTNNYSAETARKEGISQSKGFGGYAFGGYARKVIGEILHDLEENYPSSKIENHPLILEQCLNFANSLIQSVKKV